MGGRTIRATRHPSREYPGAPKDYPRVLREVFEELREYWENETAEATAETEASVLAELALPAEANTRLCLFLVPREVLSFYRRGVFPLAELHGFVPVVPEDLVAPGDSMAAGVSAAIQRAELIVLDTASGIMTPEMAMVFGSQPQDDDSILVVLSASSDLPIEQLPRVILKRPDRVDGTERFLDQIGTWFELRAGALLPTLDREPQRLLEKGEGRAAVISAVALLESELGRALGGPETTPTRDRKSRTLHGLIREAGALGLLQGSEQTRVQGWVRRRNELVHNRGQIGLRAASNVVAGITELVERWRGKGPSLDEVRDG